MELKKGDGLKLGIAIGILVVAGVTYAFMSGMFSQKGKPKAATPEQLNSAQMGGDDPMANKPDAPSHRRKGDMK